MQNRVFTYNKPFELECGTTLPGLEVAYTTHGTLNPAADNVIFVCHALTANANPAEWWPNMVGEGLVFNTQRYFVVCANILGSCYGTTGPASVNPLTGQKWEAAFPMVTIKDMVKAHRLLVKALGIQSIYLACGGSLGGQQALEWAIEEPQFIKNLFLIATNLRHSAWGIAFNEAQRMALNAGEAGLEAARAIAMLSYRNYDMYHNTQTDEEPKLEGFRAAGYQQYQGQKLKKRFNPHSYRILSQAMDSHHIGRGRTGFKEALQKVTAHTLVAGIASDILFPPQEQRLIAENIPGAVFELMDSAYGHDGFLVETDKITALLKKHFSI